MTDIASAIKAAEAALGKGDYNFCIKIVDNLISSYPEGTKTGAQLRLLKVTAYMGIGEEEKAINICQLLVKSKEVSISQQAKQLLSILDAPCLPRPSNWSVEIPKIEMESSLKSSYRKQKKKAKKNNFPPTGPTKNLDLGFSLITLLIIVLITLLLSGCVDISTKLNVSNVDRLDLTFDIDSNSGKSTSWQTEFANNLEKEQSILKIQNDENSLHIQSPAIRFDDVNELLSLITTVASETSGFKINQPEIVVNNNNWIIGSKQKLDFYFDLSELPKIPELKMNIILDNIQNQKNFKTTPLRPDFKDGLMTLPLEIGQLNKLEISYWKWNKITIGIILIISITLLSLFLQTFRLKMGFGFPELPP